MKRRNEEAAVDDVEGPSTAKAACPDSEDPFHTHNCESDVTLVVEDRKIHVHKSVLSVYSPVFSVMFTSDFAEKDAKEIELPGKKYDAMIHFLLQMYPVHSYKHIEGMKGAFYWCPNHSFSHSALFFKICKGAPGFETKIIRKRT